MAVLPVSLLPVFNFFYKNNKSEPMTNRYKVRIILFWWTLQGSNLGRADLQSAALPTELRVRVGCESGLEPPTSGATNRRSDQLSYSHYEWKRYRVLIETAQGGADLRGVQYSQNSELLLVHLLKNVKSSGIISP